MRTVISFSEGCSGNFLATFITNFDVAIHKHIVDINRVDKTLRFNHINLINYGWAMDIDDPSTHRKDLDNFTVIVTHSHDTQKIKSTLNPDQIIRIEPVTGLFTAIYNVFTKKLIDDDKADIMKQWPSAPSYCYDKTFEHLKFYYAKFSNSQLTADEILFDFGWIWDLEKMNIFLKETGMTGDFDLLKRYQASQLPLLLNLPSTNNMSEIVAQIPSTYFEQSPWFACYCLFCFELNNNLKEEQRLWTIDNLSQVLGPNDLVDLSVKYQQ
jgi:hypothetical protein